MDIQIAPTVTKDSRFRAGCKLVRTGKAHCGAVEMFAALVEETRCHFGEASLNSAATYYEYGHALFRGACRRAEEGGGGSGGGEGQDDLDRKPRAVEVGSNSNSSSSSSAALKPKMEGVEKCISGESSRATEGVEDKIASAVPQHRDNEDDDDVKLALELMENAWAILDDYVQSHDGDSVIVQTDPDNSSSSSSSINHNNNSKEKEKEKEKYDDKASKSYLNWAKDQQPRILLGIGDLFDFQKKHGDAVDAYTRAIPLRERYLPTDNDDKNTRCGATTDLLKRRRQLVEVLVLVAETLLKCPVGEDVVAVAAGSEVLLVEDKERVDFARGYYDKAKEELQETVFLMGKLAALGKDITSEKEDICFIATMLMGVGTTLVELDERQANGGTVSDKESTAKKRKL